MKAGSKLLLVLVDGLPYWKVSSELTPFLASIPVQGPLEPGIGFSINIYPELFAGKQPDDLGYFNKWRLKQPEEYALPPWLARLAARMADLSRVSQLGSRALHKLWERISGEENLANVPFRLLHYYARNPAKEILKTDDYPTVFNMWDMKLLLSYEFPGRLGEKDGEAVSAALHAMQSDASLFVLLGDLDTTAHVYGLDERFDVQIRRLDVWVEELAEAFQRSHGSEAHIVVLSDHGMARTDPRKAVLLNLERRFGPICYDRYVPFVDALMLRVWVRDQKLLAGMADYLGGVGGGRILSEEERRYFGVLNPDFGDIIFLLEEGYAFYPSFFGARFPKAMHGYHPKLDSQQAYYGYIGTDSVQLPTRSLEVFSVFQTLRSRGRE